MPIGRTIPRIGRVGMVIGEPLDFSRFQGMESDRYVLRSVTDEIMVALQRLGEQQYDDVYASTVKDRAARASSAASVHPVRSVGATRLSGCPPCTPISITGARSRSSSSPLDRPGCRRRGVRRDRDAAAARLRR
jgi:hypothetical protein